MTTINLSFKPHFGAFVIESLTFGMYGESRNALREYIQNSFDALRQAIDEGLITQDEARVDVEMDADRSGITIRDYGVGIRTESAIDVLASIGASNKDYRQNAGFRGIGRLAGIVFCDRLIFRTKAKGQAQLTEAVFRADELREKLAPGGNYAKDAAQTLAECVEATLKDDADVDGHYFEVRLEGFHNPPVECVDVKAMRIFLAQVAPLPYAPDFSFASEIEAAARAAQLPIDSIHLFVKDGHSDGVELYKPYGRDFGVKRTRAPLSTISYEVSPTGKWFGWVGRTRIPGTIKDTSKGIRIRVRNIQIDDTGLMREIFAESRLVEKPRSSYGRFAEWYVGEIFVDPTAAIPNARRDGFEENQSWFDMRDELDLQIATPLGKQAYRTSKADQLSLENLTRSLNELIPSLDLLEAEGYITMEKLHLSLEAAQNLRARFASALTLAEPAETAAIQALAGRLGDIQRRLEALVARAPAHSCDEEIGVAIEEVAGKLLRALRARLSPEAWQHARAVINEVTGIGTN